MYIRFPSNYVGAEEHCVSVEMVQSLLNTKYAMYSTACEFKFCISSGPLYTVAMHKLYHECTEVRVMFA